MAKDDLIDMINKGILRFFHIKICRAISFFFFF